MSELWVNLNEALEYYTPSPNDDDFDKAWIRSTRRYLESVAVDVETISDGYHNFADLYEQRMILSAALAKTIRMHGNQNCMRTVHSRLEVDGLSWALILPMENIHITMS